MNDGLKRNLQNILKKHDWIVQGKINYGNDYSENSYMKQTLQPTKNVTS